METFHFSIDVERFFLYLSESVELKIFDYYWVNVGSLHCENRSRLKNSPTHRFNAEFIDLKPSIGSITNADLH